MSETENVLTTQARIPNSVSFVAGRSRTQHGLYVSVILAALLLTFTLVYSTGGTSNGYTYIMLLPVLFGAAAYGVYGGLLTGLAGSLLLGPYMPMDVISDTEQPLEHWLVRLGIFLMVGAVGGTLYDRLRYQTREKLNTARTDPSTDLPNQVALREALEAYQAEYSETQGNCALILMRATDLAEIVDVIGIEAGDRIIGQLGRHLLSVCPEVKGGYRSSTAELAFLVEYNDHEMLKRIARTLSNAAGASFEVDNAPVRIQPALGLGHAGSDTDVDAGEYLRRARVALRAAALMEKDWVAYEPSFDKDNASSVELIAQVEQALEMGEFELHYQPKIRLSDGQAAGVEALARWHRPSQGPVPPGTFMPKFEKTSLIETFSRFVIRTATDYARSGEGVPVSINLAARNLVDEALINGLITGLREAGIPGEHFEVEVTESALMRDPETAISHLQRLRGAGIGVSIDDFGTGYASYAYLRRLPASNMKIDRTFIRPIEADRKAARLVLAMIEVGHSLDMTVTAEGVETEGQARILANLGCDFAQGFLWSAALPKPGLQEWLASRESGGDGPG